MPKLSLPQTAYRIDDPLVFEANERGVLAGAQGLALTPWMVAKKVLSQPDGMPVASVMLFLPIVVAANGDLARLAASLPWLTHPTLTAWAVGIGLALFVLTPKLIWLARHIPGLRRDLARGSLRKVSGSITWEKRRFVARSADGRMLEDLADRFNAAPGSYEFIVLPESSILLSMRPVGSETLHDQATTELYGRIFGFTPSDLARHARGDASTWERLRAVPGTAGFSGTAIFILLLFVPVVVFLIPYVSTLLRDGGLISAPGILSSIFIVAVLAGLFALIIIVRQKMQARVETLEGRVHVEEILRSKSTTRYSYVLGGRRFRVSQQAFAAFVEKTRYRIYALEGAERFLSIEAVEDTKTPPRTGASHLQG